MRVVYKHNGYTLIWSNGGSKGYDIGGYHAFDKNGKLVLHATTTATQLTEEEAKEILENIPELLKVLLNHEIDWEYVERRNAEIREILNKTELER